jgi:hypothetical protein
MELMQRQTLNIFEHPHNVSTVPNPINDKVQQREIVSRVFPTVSRLFSQQISSMHAATP